MGTLILVIILALALIFIVSIFSVKAKQEEKEADDKEKMEQGIAKVSDFTISHKTIPSDHSFIFADDNTSQRFIIARPRYQTIVNYNEVTKVELVTDNEILSSKSTSKVIGRAIVGGVLAGGIGAVIGGVTGGNNKKKTTVSFVKVSISTSNPEHPSFNLTTFDSKKMFGLDSVKKDKTGWKEYLRGLSQAKSIESIISHIIDESNTEEANNSSNKIISTADELSKLGTLLKDGLLTQEEFEQEKAKILNKG